MVPRSMVIAIALGGVFYVACVAVQSMGFGTGTTGVSAFAGSAAPLGELAGIYVGSTMEDALHVAALISALGAGLGCASVSARMLFALARDGKLDTRLAAVSNATGAPARGLAAVMVFDIALLAVFAAAGTAPMDVFFYLATLGTLSLLFMYVLTNVAAIGFLRRGWERVLPAAGIAVAGYVLYHHLWPVPASPFDVFPYIVLAWLASGIVISRFI
jgi:amino acid transporter